MQNQQINLANYRGMKRYFHRAVSALWGGGHITHAVPTPLLLGIIIISRSIIVIIIIRQLLHIYNKYILK